MRYLVAKIDGTGLTDWQTDLLMQDLAEAGFDSFEQEGTLSQAYIPALQGSDITAHVCALLDGYSATLITLDECPDQNWNSVWESEHTVEELPLGVRITPHGAFGAGHHETTSMMVEGLLHTPLLEEAGAECPILDMGTGTGVLAIMAAKRGARCVLAVDIDENSVRNAEENAVANGVQIIVQQGSEVPTGRYQLILANIHRNILLRQMPDYARCLMPGGELWLSGFYEADVPALLDAAEQYGLQHIITYARNEWRMLVVRRIK